ncbi:MAG: ChrR family anti-sigma-E factor [Alsobacter sp.]
MLAGYAAGTLVPQLHALVAAHLAIKPDNRRYVESLELIGGEAVDRSEAVPLSNRDARLAAIFADDQVAAPPAAVYGCAVVPAPIAALLGRPLADLPWRTRLPGIREVSLKDCGTAEASLLWIKSGRVMPSHTHDGTEVTLVLQGGFGDATGHYRRGDIAIADGDVDHRPKADDDADCICFAVIDAPLRLTGPVGRLLQRFLGH